MNAHFLLVLDKWQIYRKPDSAGGRATPFNEFSEPHSSETVVNFISATSASVSAERSQRKDQQRK